MISSLRRKACWVFPILLVVVATGCGTPTGTVSGTVKAANGKPLPRGLITFLSEVGNRDPVSANIVDGQYKTTPIPAGLAKVIVVPAMESPGVGVPPKEANGSDLVPEPKPTKVAKPVEVPDKYQNPDTSQLELTVKSGENTFDVDLKP